MNDRTVYEVFDAVIDMSPDDRDAWFEEHGIDSAIQHRVAVLIDLHEETNSRTIDSLGLPTPGQLAQRSGLPETIGSFKVRKLLGRGGMGAVYLAEQSAPRRDVAVKVMHAGSFPQLSLHRFAREAEYLARLNHPGIAQIYEFAVSQVSPGDHGYIVMEYVDGLPITDYATRLELSLDDRLRLLQDLTHAIHHAHLQGVTHRDLKPENVLVTERDGDVKVIDFGIARVSDHEQSVRTEVGQVLGTLAYMSPEQISGEIDLIDARTDVYSLGVLGFELITGCLPFDVGQKSIAQAARVVCEKSPPRLGEICAKARGDLELIIGKALSKDRRLRYQSAEALGADLARFRNHEPVEARPPSTSYKLRMTARRHPGLVGGVIVAFITLLGAMFWVGHYALYNKELASTASRAAALAKKNADEIERRAGPGRLLIAKNAADRLWPICPDSMPAIDTWIREHADPLRKSLDKHTLFLAELRRKALPYGPEERQRDFETHPEQKTLAEERRELELTERQLAGEDGFLGQLTPREVAILQETSRARRKSIETLEKAVRQRHTWEFEDPDLQDQHDSLRRHVIDLEIFFYHQGGVSKSVLKRRAEASTLQEMTVTGTEASSQWECAIEDIRASDRYGRLPLTPQIGLFPLGCNPDTGLWEFWHVLSGDRPEPNPDSDGVNRWILTKDTGMIFVLLPGDLAYLGRQSQDPDLPNYSELAAPHETVSEVEVEPFFLSKYEMTQGQWMKLTHDIPSVYAYSFTWYGSPRRSIPVCSNTWWNPVENVSFETSKEVLSRVSLRLPTLDEWEYGARGESESLWWTGKQAASLRGAANIADEGVQKMGGPLDWEYEPGFDDHYMVHSPVGTFRANPYGLHDVLGNVWELCANDAASHMAPACGGSFEQVARYCSLTSRYAIPRDSRNHTIGIRPARDVHFE